MNILQTPIEYLKGVGPIKADLLKKELSVFNVSDLLLQFPYRYIDKTAFHRIAELSEDSGYVQLRGVLRLLNTAGEGREKKTFGKIFDDKGSIKIVLFFGVFLVG